MNRIFENVSGKIKLMAKIVFVINVLLSLGFGIYLISELGFVFGIIMLVIAVFLSYFASIMIYGYGELIENTKK